MERPVGEKKDNRFMKELLREEDLLVLQVLRDFVDREIMPVRHLIDPDTRADFKLVRELQDKLRGMGHSRALFPPEYGGMGMQSLVSTCIACEELSRGDAGFIAAPGSPAWAMRPAILAYQEGYNSRVLDDFAQKFSGDEMYVSCFAMTEPEGGCNIESVDMHGRGISTTARLEGDEWVINGAKIWPTNSGIADLYCVVCQTDPDQGDDGIALIYVPVPIEGFTFGRFEDKMGFRSSREGPFWFENVRVPKEYRAAGPGKDAELFHDNLIFARGFSAGWAIGPAQGAFDEVLRFTKDRIAAGKPIRQHTIAANMLADMAIGIQVGRDTYINAAYIYDHPE
ncbi:MAG: acyl-CoA dehydrogenase family protein, partial [Chloroflexota bacterium]